MRLLVRVEVVPGGVREAPTTPGRPYGSGNAGLLQTSPSARRLERGAALGVGALSGAWRRLKHLRGGVPAVALRARLKEPSLERVAPLHCFLHFVRSGVWESRKSSPADPRGLPNEKQNSERWITRLVCR